jgi:hypothetical protein
LHSVGADRRQAAARLSAADDSASNLTCPSFSEPGPVALGFRIRSPGSAKGLAG